MISDPGIDSNGCKVDKVTECDLLDPEEKVTLGLGGRIVIDLGTEIFANLCFFRDCPGEVPEDNDPPDGVSILGEVRVRSVDDPEDFWTNLGTIDLALRKRIDTTRSYRFIEIVDVTNISEIYGLYEPPITGFCFCDLIFRAVKPNAVKKEEICTTVVNYVDGDGLDNIIGPEIVQNLSVTITTANVGQNDGQNGAGETGAQGTTACVPGDCTFKVWGTLVREYDGGQPGGQTGNIYRKEFLIEYPIVDTVLGTSVSFPPEGKTVENCTIGLVNGRVTQSRQGQGGFGNDFFPITGAVYAVPSGLWVRIFTDLGQFQVENADVQLAEFNLIVCGRLVDDATDEV